VVLASGATLLALWADKLPEFYSHGLFVVRAAFAVLVFPALVAAAIVLRRRAAWHKRLMLCAAIVVVVPGLERAMPVFLMGPHWSYVVDGVVDAIALAGPTYDLVTARRIHPAYLWGVGAILLGQAIVDVLAPSPAAVALLHTLGAH